MIFSYFRSIAMLALFALAIGFSSCSSKDEITTSIRINVKDSLGIVAGGVTVHLYQSQNDWWQENPKFKTAVTDENGSVTFVDLEGQKEYYFDCFLDDKNNWESEIKALTITDEVVEKNVTIDNNYIGYLCSAEGNRWQISAISADVIGGIDVKDLIMDPCAVDDIYILRKSKDMDLLDNVEDCPGTLANEDGSWDLVGSTLTLTTPSKGTETYEISSMTPTTFVSDFTYSLDLGIGTPIEVPVSVTFTKM